MNPTSSHLHLVIFHRPLPAHTGGKIDLLHKLLALHGSGVQVILHMWVDDEMPLKEAEDTLRPYCSKLFLYRRKRAWLSWLRGLPRIVGSRASWTLLHRIMADPAPVLLDGLHSSYGAAILKKAGLRVFLRLHNLESRYYHCLAQNEPLGWKQAYFRIESFLLKRYEQKIFPVFDRILAISPRDLDSLLRQRLPASLILPFSGWDGRLDRHTPPAWEETKPIVLLHADLSVRDNTEAALMVCRILSHDERFNWVLAGKQPPAELVREVAARSNVRLVPDPDEVTMTGLLREARVVWLYSGIREGFKLKLLRTVQYGYHIIANETFFDAGGLEPFIVRADTPEKILHSLAAVWHSGISREAWKARQSWALRFNDEVQASLLREAVLGLQNQ